MHTIEHKLAYKADDPNRLPGERWVTMSNALTRASHGLTLAEKRIIACAISKLDSAKTASTILRTTISAAEYAETFCVDLNTAYEQLKDAAAHLFDRKITFYEPSFKRRGKPLPPTRVQMRWIGAARYQDGEGWIELSWWPDVIKHLCGLRKQFTTYQLQQASALRSIYSWRLLELLMRFKDTGWAEYSIEDFSESMEATDKQRQNFAQIRRKIIEPAIKELQEKDGWLIQWRAIKSGRKVSKIRFDFVRDPQMRLDVDV